jgi:ketosteroid isomerase-like protein
VRQLYAQHSRVARAWPTVGVRDTRRAMSPENVDAVRRSFEGWNRGDVDAWLEAAHPDVEFYSEVARRMEGAETVTRGVAGLRQFWDDWHSVWNLKIELAEIRDLGDTVVVLGQMRARGEASGVNLEQPVAYLYEFERGLARTVRAYLDPQLALEAVAHSSRTK